jgi:hypothetical protein
MLHLYFLFVRSVDHGTTPRLPQDTLEGKMHRVRGTPFPPGSGRVSDQVGRELHGAEGEGSLDDLPWDT